MARAPDSAVWETGPGGLPFLSVETDLCRARLTSYGAHLCEWTPAGQTTSALFLSPRSAFAVGRAIRGGVPVCFPWFATHASDPGKPAHGFVRTRAWKAGEITRDAAGDVRVVLRLADDAETRALWDEAFAATLTLSLGATLAITAEIENTGARPIGFELALHTYLAVGDVARVRLSGLERARFLDKTDGLREKVEGPGPLALAGETDRVYLDTTATVVIDDPVLRRRIRVAKTGSRATVVWNPGPARAQTVADLGGDTWRHFVCVETASCGPHAVRLAPGARHAMAARVDVAAEG